MDIKIVVEKNHDGTRTRIVGFVNGRDIVSMSNHIFGKWNVGSSTCLPSDMEEAQAIVECMVQTFAMAKTHGA